MQFHHGATYLQNLSILANGSIIPLYNALLMKQKENAFNIKQLDRQIESYKVKLCQIYYFNNNVYKKAIKKKKDFMKRSARSVDMRHEHLELLLDEKFDNDTTTANIATNTHANSSNVTNNNTNFGNSKIEHKKNTSSSTATTLSSDKDYFKSPTMVADNLYDLSSIEDDNSVKSNLEHRLKDPVYIFNFN